MMMLLHIKLNNRLLKINDGRSLFAGTVGLMFNKLESIDGCLIPTNSIHTAFCKPLDLLWLDDGFMVIEVQKTKGFGVYSCRKAKYCLELKHGLVKARVRMKVVMVWLT